MAGTKEGCFPLTEAARIMAGDVLIQEEEVDWSELLVVGVRVEDTETLLLLMEEDGTLRSWDGPSDTRHCVLWRRGQAGRPGGRR